MLVTVQSSSTLCWLVCRRRQHFVGYCADVNTLLGSVQTSSTLCWLLCRCHQHFVINTWLVTVQTSSTLCWLLCRRPRPSCSSRSGRKWLTSPFPPNPSSCRYGTMTVLRTPTRTPCRDTHLSASRSVHAVPILFCSDSGP